ncbi:YqaJ viral recombinase family nuclease [Vreelandella jeotgali]|uniref:YqaJ viral recombinase family nuclease n=1 Tax=Vreelandella jeotgali TaxID=553386 RepID=UPI00034830B2|nr:YqaJ viral recombinase family protein [Halomonas jeotgali]
MTQTALHTKTPLFPVSPEEVERSTLIPFDQAGQERRNQAASATDTPEAPPLSSRDKPGSVTASVLDAIEQSSMPAPVSRDARVKRPKPPQRRYRDQARRLVDTRALDRNAWLDIRQGGIGSSDAAAAIGLHPYKSQLELWLEKTGRQSGLTEPDRDAQLTSPLHWGQILEPIVADHYAKHTGYRVQRVNAILQHTDYPWMMANLDREVVGNADVDVLECKTAGVHGARLWQFGVPVYVQLQVMHQLAVTGQQAADVAVLLGGHELQIHRVERDDDMIEQMIALERQFWEYVEQDVAPPANGSASDDRALRQLFPRDDGEVLDFTDDDTLSEAFANLQQVRQQLDDLKKREAKLKHYLQQAMGTATGATFPSGSLSWKQSKPGTRLDTKRLQQEHPEICADYLKTVPGSRRFIVRQ